MTKFQNMQIFERSIDLLLDTRLPHAVPFHIWRLAHYHLPTNQFFNGDILRVCLTFDIEHDFRRPESSESSRRFLDYYMPWAQSRGWHSTLYVQGSLLSEYSELLREASQYHEIGLHGFYHEVWGRSRWWQYSQRLVGISRSEKGKRLQMALDAFDCAGLERPLSFRAPYLNADRETLDLLAQNGFTSDSSPSTYLGALPVPRLRGDLWQISVTANPRPKRSGVTFRFPELSIGSMLRMDKQEIQDTVAMAVHLQQAASRQLPPHLVLLGHPWEFEETPGVVLASEANWERLDQILKDISEIYPLEFVPISELIDCQKTETARRN